ncbi:hypothetical protein OWV82_003743, partial [Melia azedarach]
WPIICYPNFYIAANFNFLKLYLKVKYYRIYIHHIIDNTNEPRAHRYPSRRPTTRNGAVKFPNFRSEENDSVLARERQRESYIFCSFSALTTGFAFAICSLPTPLKSNEQSCCSGYLWVPQNTDPHRHLKPVSPTRLLHVKHLFTTAVCCTAAATNNACFSSSFASAVGFSCKDKSTDGVDKGDGVDDDDEAEEEIKVWLKACLAEEDCCSFN